MKQLSLFIGIGFVVAAAAPVSAQRRTSVRDSVRKAIAAAIPVDARPPKGMCRVWLDAVPAAQQPAATDCAAAVKNRPPNGRVIFGDDFADTSKATTADKPKLPSDVKGFTGVKPPLQLWPKRPPNR
ncbi:MAG TPA: hypothetical protein VIJ48_09685 [Acidimicrobiia bacterium]